MCLSERSARATSPTCARNPDSRPLLFGPHGTKARLGFRSLRICKWALGTLAQDLHADSRVKCWRCSFNGLFHRCEVGKCGSRKILIQEQKHYRALLLQHFVLGSLKRMELAGSLIFACDLQIDAASMPCVSLIVNASINKIKLRSPITVLFPVVHIVGVPCSRKLKTASREALCSSGVALQLVPHAGSPRNECRALARPGPRKGQLAIE